MPLSSAHLRRLADELDAEERAERQELAEAETAEERAEIRDRIAKLEARNEELERQLAGRETPEPAEPEEPEPDEDEDEPEAAKPRMRRGRKRGQVYQDRKGEPGYVFQGDDEPDLVPVEEAS